MYWGSESLDHMPFKAVPQCSLLFSVALNCIMNLHSFRYSQLQQLPKASLSLDVRGLRPPFSIPLIPTTPQQKATQVYITILTIKTIEWNHSLEGDKLSAKYDSFPKAKRKILQKLNPSCGIFP